METVYIETTIVSYLVAKPSRDLIVAAHQAVTQEWWREAREGYRCLTSDQTLTEAAQGDATQARLRLAALAEVVSVPLTGEVEALAAELLACGALPARARADAIHLASATRVQADYLVTWNCRHLANAHILRKLEHEAARRGWD